MELIELMRNRRSVRKYTGEIIPQEKIERILQAGLLSPTGKAKREWEFILVRNKEMLEKLSHCRVGAARMLEGADSAVVVLGDESKSDVWIEDCSAAMANMYLMADSLGVGSCWIQGRLREAEDGRTTEEYVRELLGVPKEYRLQAILSLGMPESHPLPYELEELKTEKIHREFFVARD